MRQVPEEQIKTAHKKKLQAMKAKGM